MPVIKILSNDVFYALSGLNPQKAYVPEWVTPIVLKNCASMLTPCLVKHFRLCLSIYTFPSCWKYAYVQPVPKKGDRLRLSLTGKSISICQLQTFFLIASTVSVWVALLMISLPFFLILGHPLLLVSVTFAVPLDMSKAFDRVWHKSLLSKLPSYGFYPSLCIFISSFLSDRSISAVVDGDCSTPIAINSGVPQGSVLSPTIFFIFINHLLFSTQNQLHAYADDCILHYLTHFRHRPTQQELHNSRLEAARRLTSDLSIISNWGKRNLVSFQCLKNSFSSSINSTASSRQLSPILRTHTTVSFYYN